MLSPTRLFISAVPIPFLAIFPGSTVDPGINNQAISWYCSIAFIAVSTGFPIVPDNDFNSDSPSMGSINPTVPRQVKMNCFPLFPATVTAEVLRAYCGQCSFWQHLAQLRFINSKLLFYNFIFFLPVLFSEEWKKHEGITGWVELSRWRTSSSYSLHHCWKQKYSTLQGFFARKREKNISMVNRAFELLLTEMLLYNTAPRVIAETRTGTSAAP